MLIKMLEREQKYRIKPGRFFFEVAACFHCLRSGRANPAKAVALTAHRDNYCS